MAEVKVWRGAEGVHVERADWLTPDGVMALRDALAEHDPRVGHYEIHHWTVERLDHGDVALFAWSRGDDSRPILTRYRPSRPESALLTDLTVWRATLAGLGLRDAE